MLDKNQYMWTIFWTSRYALNQ